MIQAQNNYSNREEELNAEIIQLQQSLREAQDPGDRSGLALKIRFANVDLIELQRHANTNGKKTTFTAPTSHRHLSPTQQTHAPKIEDASK